jgi:hypothetical protein
MRFAGHEGTAAVHRCPICSSRAFDGMISGNSNLPVPIPRRVAMECPAYLPRPIERHPAPNVGPIVGTLAVIGGVVVAAAMISALMSDD